MKLVKKTSETRSKVPHERQNSAYIKVGAAHTRQLSERDSLLIAEKLANPPEPNRKLKALFADENQKTHR